MKDPHQDDTTSLYNLNAQEYKSNTQNFIFPAEMFESFLALVHGRDILDIGCAYGRDMLRMQEKGFFPQGIEISQELIELADNSIQKNIILADMTELGSLFTETNFDGIFAAASILHLEKEIGLKVLKDVFFLLKTEGVFFFEAKLSFGEETYTELKESISLPGSYKKYTLYSEEELDTFLQELGFSILKTHKNENNGNIWKIYICKK